MYSRGFEMVYSSLFWVENFRLYLNQDFICLVFSCFPKISEEEIVLLLIFLQNISISLMAVMT